MRKTPPLSTLLSERQIAALRERSDWRGILLVAHAWGTIALAAAAVVWLPHVVTWAFAVMIIGSRQLGLLILMHDAAHGALCRSPRLNYWLGQLCCAWPTLADTAVYRAYHLEHHTRTQDPDDPDIILTGHYPITRASLRRKLTRDLLGRTGLAQRRQQVLAALGRRGQSPGERLQHFWRELGPQTLAQLVLLGVAAACGHMWAYLLLWLVPLLTWQQLVLRVRNIAEHAVVRDANDPFGNARTTIANPLERLLVAPYWVNYHLEHHLAMWVPCYRLPRLRRFLVDNGHGERIETEHGYLAVLRKVTVDGPDEPQRRRERASGTFATGFEQR
ncbi:MAG: fatty acid desaturase family protein [Gammaproteobacteria bacterium]